MTHEMDLLTDYCTRCGREAADIVARMDYRCEPPQNLVAISHIVRGAALERLGRIACFGESS